MTLTHGSLFSGIGGFDLAALAVGFDNRWSCEIDPFGRDLLQKRFPNSTHYADITQTDWRTAERVDIISGGFPCQPFSFAGKMQAQADQRYLWPAMLGVVCEIQPRWVVGENVAGLVQLGLDQVFDDLEALGYAVATFVIPAAAVGAPHQRDRVWITAHHDGERSEKQRVQKPERPENAWTDDGGGVNRPTANAKSGRVRRESIRNESEFPEFRDDYPTGCQPTPNATGGETRREGLGGFLTDIGHGLPRFDDRSQLRDFQIQIIRQLCRVDDGLPAGLDESERPPHGGRDAFRRKRLKALGNAVVPQVAKVIFESIQLIEANANY